MGMYSLNIRLLTENGTITVEKDKDGVMFYSVYGNGNITKKELLQSLLNNNIDIMVKANDIYGESYLINKGVEMLIHTNKDETVRFIELRICLCFLNDGLKECYEFASTVNKIMPIRYWITNEYGTEVKNQDDFVNKHIEFVKDKYNIFRSSFGDINIRLTESEFYMNIKKRGVSQKRRLKEYRDLRLTNQYY